MSERTQSTDTLDQQVQLLKDKKNIILQGAPGTGKTYTTASLAVRLCNPSFTELGDHAKVMEEYERLREEGQIAFCTFHQSMDYEDFVEGLKPEIQDGHVTYKVESGIFKRICDKAGKATGEDIIACIDKYIQQIRGYENRREISAKPDKTKLLVWYTEGNRTINMRNVLYESEKGEQYAPYQPNIDKIKAQAIGKGVENNHTAYANAFIKAVKEEYHVEEGTRTKPHVLIIDEINRGNISRIFGELITLLEADKRTGEGAHPMNTTDRSTGAIDSAVRRRFAFITLETSREVVERSIQDKDVRTKALALFDEINGKGAEDKTSFIATHQAGDFDLEDLKVGHSYFIAKDLPELQRKMRYEVIPLLHEYIKDGILQAKEGDGEYFSAWEQGECRGPKQAEVSKDPEADKE